METSRKMLNSSYSNKHPYSFFNSNVFIILFLTVILGICLLIAFTGNKCWILTNAFLVSVEIFFPQTFLCDKLYYYFLHIEAFLE